MSDSEDHSQNTAQREIKRRAVSFVENIRHPIVIRFGTNLRRQRQELGMTQEQLATAAKLSRSYISEVECGRQNIALERAARLADALGCQLIDLIK